MIIPTKTQQAPAMMPVPTPPMPLQARMDEAMVKSGYFMMNTKFTEETVAPIIKGIIGLNMLDESEQPKKITIVINPPGGAVFSLVQLLDVMEASTIPIHTVASGMAASCGCVLLMAGDKRFATPNSQIMSHQYAAGMGGKEHELYGRIESFKMTSKFMVDSYKKYTGLTEEVIRDKLLGPTDVWLSPKQAKRFKIIDKVV